MRQINHKISINLNKKCYLKIEIVLYVKNEIYKIVISSKVIHYPVYAPRGTTFIEASLHRLSVAWLLVRLIYTWTVLCPKRQEQFIWLLELMIIIRGGGGRISGEIKKVQKHLLLGCWKIPFWNMVKTSKSIFLENSNAACWIAFTPKNFEMERGTIWKFRYCWFDVLRFLRP